MRKLKELKKEWKFVLRVLFCQKQNGEREGGGSINSKNIGHMLGEQLVRDRFQILLVYYFASRSYLVHLNSHNIRCGIWR